MLYETGPKKCPSGAHCGPAAELVLIFGAKHLTRFSVAVALFVNDSVCRVCLIKIIRSHFPGLGLKILAIASSVLPGCSSLGPPRSVAYSYRMETSKKPNNKSLE